MKSTTSVLALLVATLLNLPQSSAVPGPLIVTSLPISNPTDIPTSPPADTSAINMITSISTTSTLELTQIITLSSTIYEAILSTTKTSTVFKTSPTSTGLSDGTVIDGHTVNQLEAYGRSNDAIQYFFIAVLTFMLVLFVVAITRRWHSPHARKVWWTCWM